MKYLQIFIVFILISIPLPAQINSATKGLKITGERWYDWNGASWVQNHWKNCERDSIGTINHVIDYYYDSGIVTSSTTWNCTYSDTSYTLKYTTDGDGCTMCQ